MQDRGVVDDHPIAEGSNLGDEDGAVLSPCNQIAEVMDYLDLGNGGSVQLHFGEGSVELGHVGEGPLVGPDLAGGSAHEGSPQLIDDHDFGDNEGIRPHDGELHLPVFSVELDLIVLEAHDHDIKDGVIACMHTLRILVGHLEYLIAFHGHDLRAAIPEEPAQVHIPINEVDLLRVVGVAQIESVLDIVLVGVD